MFLFWELFTLHNISHLFPQLLSLLPLIKYITPVFLQWFYSLTIFSPDDILAFLILICTFNHSNSWFIPQSMLETSLWTGLGFFSSIFSFQLLIQICLLAVWHKSLKLLVFWAETRWTWSQLKISFHFLFWQVMLAQIYCSDGSYRFPWLMESPVSLTLLLIRGQRRETFNSILGADLGGHKFPLLHWLSL